MCGRSSVTKSKEKRMTNELAENNNFPRASRFFAHFSADTARLRRENAQFPFISKLGYGS